MQRDSMSSIHLSVASKTVEDRGYKCELLYNDWYIAYNTLRRQGLSDIGFVQLYVVCKLRCLVDVHFGRRCCSILFRSLCLSVIWVFAALSIVAKRYKIGVQCVYMSNRNMGSTFRLVPFSTPQVYPNPHKRGVELEEQYFDIGIPAKRRHIEQHFVLTVWEVVGRLQLVQISTL